MPKDAVAHGPTHGRRVRANAARERALRAGHWCGLRDSCAVGRVSTMQAGREQISAQWPLFHLSYFLIIFKSLQIQKFVQV
jgi:hypothetical protein